MPASGNNNPEKTVIGNSTSRGRIVLPQERLFSAICEVAMLRFGRCQRKFINSGKFGISKEVLACTMQARPNEQDRTFSGKWLGAGR